MSSKQDKKTSKSGKKDEKTDKKDKKDEKSEKKEKKKKEEQEEETVATDKKDKKSSKEKDKDKKKKDKGKEPEPVDEESESDEDDSDFDIADICLINPVPEDFLALVMTQVRDVLTEKLYNDFFTKFQTTKEFKNDKSRRFEPKDIMAREGPEERKEAQVKSNLIYHYIYDKTSPGYFLFYGFLSTENALNLAWCVSTFNEMEQYENDKELFMILLNGIWPAVKEKVNSLSRETIEKIEHGMKSVNSGSPDDPDTPDDDDGKSSGQDPSRAGKKADKKSSKDDKKSGKGDKKSSKKSK